MKSASFAYAMLIAGFFAFHAQPGSAAPGQSFPDHKCTCKGCGPKGKDGTASDVTGQCPTVCKDKTVFDKGSEPNDYCKAASKRLPGRLTPAIPSGQLKSDKGTAAPGKSTTAATKSTTPATKAPAAESTKMK